MTPPRSVRAALMTSALELDDRSADVLRALIQLHIDTGEPVGSENLSHKLNRKLSPATLRNIMADLERRGLLDHPHTSAGRVPTDDGYRMYVDGLIARRPLSRRDTARIRDSLRPEQSPGELLESASQVLSALSNNIGFVIGPDASRAALIHIDFVRIAPQRILVVTVSRTGLVSNKVIEIEEEMAQIDLQACANYINAEFSGLALDDIRRRLLDLMSHEKALYDSLLRKVVAVGERAFAIADSAGPVYVDGTANILDKPEFEDVERMRELFRTFEEKSRLVRILNECLEGDGMRILIGRENPDPQMRDLTLVTAGYSVTDGGGPRGLGVIGSTRMEYARVISLVDHVARAVSSALKSRD